ncbi:MAG: hypothetical protein Q7T11_01755, partial [Deltaproteobacteria bacterium]|nr:hypothetical protein [Deltaproteobacteria bacterium]
MKVVFSFLLVLILFQLGCSHKKSEVLPSSVSGVGGVPVPAGGSQAIRSDGDGPLMPPDEGLPDDAAAAVVQGVACPAEAGSYLLIDSYLPAEERVLGPLAARTPPSFPGYQNHAGGRINDFQIYRKEDGLAYMFLNYGRTLMEKKYVINASQSDIDQPSQNFSVEVPAVVEKVLSYSNPSSLTGRISVAATELGIYFYDGPRLVAHVPLPEKIVALAIDHDAKDLYAAGEKAVYRFKLNINAGCVEQVVRREAFLDRSIKKIEVSEGKLFILSEKSVYYPEMNSSWLPPAFKKMGEGWLKQLPGAVESLWDSSFTRLDAILLNTGERQTLSSRNWTIQGLSIGRFQVNDFFISQGRLHIVAGHWIRNADLGGFSASLNNLLREKCGNAQAHCAEGAKAIAQTYWNYLLQQPALAGREALKAYYSKPALLAVFNVSDALQFLPFKAFNVDDGIERHPDFWSGLSDAKGAAFGDQIYLAGS